MCRKRKIIKNFFDRLRTKNLKKNEQFNVNFIFTYLLTVIFSIIVIMKSFEGNMVSSDYEGSIWNFIASSTGGFDFGYCKNLDAKMYLTTKLFEALIPTTLTFGGSIFILQATGKKSNYLNAFLAIVLFMLSMIGVLFMDTQLISMLKTYMWILVILFMAAIVFSGMMFSLQNENIDSHKQEPSDGNIVG